MYHAFNPTEMEILAGYIYGCQHILIPVREKGIEDKIKIVRYELVPLPANLVESDLIRPYTPQERFLEAVKVFADVKKVKFENCKYHPANNTIEALGRMDAKREAASKYIFDAIKNWDEKLLASFYEKHKGTLEGAKLGFKPTPAPPLETSHSVSELEDLAQVKHSADINTASALSFDEEPILTESVTVAEAEPEKRKPGRPKNNP